MNDYRSQPKYKQPSITAYKPCLGDTMTSREQRENIDRVCFPQVRRKRIMRSLVGFGLLLAVLAFACSCTSISFERIEYHESGAIKAETQGNYRRVLTRQSVAYNPSTGVFSLAVSTDSEPIIKAVETGVKLGAAGVAVAP